MLHHDTSDTICALATTYAESAIALIRVSGPQAITITHSIFSGKDLTQVPSQTLHFGKIIDGKTLIDEVLVSVFKGPKTYTGENLVEISCHGSLFIQEKIISLLIQKGARMATKGEFTMRAFLNGKMDLAQAEAVADLISSKNETTHQLALKQLRGGYSSELKILRDQLIDFASLIELELDFGEEDVEFADRADLKQTTSLILSKVHTLSESFRLGNALKKGIPVAIVGEPNVGKSTLLNTLLNEEKAIVSEIAGTTRDVIEDEINIEGILFRFIDTAGIRETKDTIESLGIKKTFQKIEEALIVIEMIDGSLPNQHDNALSLQPHQKKLLVINKFDQIHSSAQPFPDNAVFISAKNKYQIDVLKKKLLELSGIGLLKNEDVVVTNIRHVEALNKTEEALQEVLYGLSNGLSSDLVAMSIRKSLYHLGSITGEISSDDLLTNIFSRFCIGK